MHANILIYINIRCMVAALARRLHQFYALHCARLEIASFQFKTRGSQVIPCCYCWYFPHAAAIRENLREYVLIFTNNARCS